MALGQADFSQRALLLLAAGDPNSVWLSMETEAGLAQPQALQELGDDVADDPGLFGLLQQEYSVALTNGTAVLTSAVGALSAVADIIWESVPRGHVKDTATGARLIYIPNRMDFEGYQLPGQYYFTTYQSAIFTRSANSNNYDNDKFDVQGPLSVLANYDPSIGTASTLPLQLETHAIRKLAVVLARKYPMPVPAKT